MKRVSAPFFFFCLLLLFAFPKVAVSQSLGVNIAGKHGPEYIKWAAEMSGDGGAVTIMAKPGDAGMVQQLFDDCARTSCGMVVVRADWAGSNPGSTPNQSADAYVASLGSINTHGISAYVMPVNEPNMSREVGGTSNLQQAALQTQTYVDTLRQRMDEAGVFQKFGLLSPMINRSHPNYREFLGYFRPGFFEQFVGIATNSYLFPDNCGSDLSCGSNPLLGITDYSEDLRLMGVPNAKIFALEMGEVFADPSCANRGGGTCPSFDPERIAKLLSSAIIEWSKNPNFVMATVLSYDPEVPGHPDWINSLLADFIKESNLKNAHKLPPSQWSDELKKKFENWLAEKIKKGAVKKCPDGFSGYGTPGQMDKMCRGEGIAGAPQSAKEISDYFGETKGTFSFTDFVLFWPNRNASDANQQALENAAEEIIRSTKYDVSDNSKVADNLQAVNRKLVPPGEDNKNKENISQGEIRLELCIEGSTDWYYPKETIKIKIPASYQKASTNGRQVMGFVSPPGTGSLFFADAGRRERENYFAGRNTFKKKRKFLAMKPEKGKVLGTGDEGKTEPKKIKKNGYVRIGPDGRAIYSLTIDTYPGVGDVTVEVWANGQKIGLLSGPNNVNNPNEGGRLWVGNQGSGAWYENDNPVMNGIFAKDGQDLAISFRIKYNYKGVSDENGGADLTCTVGADGSSSCSETPPPMPPPPPKQCAPVSDRGINIGQKGADPNGQVPVWIKKDPSANPVEGNPQEMVTWRQNPLTQAMERIVEIVTETIGWKKPVKIIVNFYSSVPFTQPDEGVQRLGVYAKTCLPGTCPDFAHGRSAGNEFKMDSANSRGSDKTAGDVDAYTYGQGGPDKMWDYNLDSFKGMLNPPRFGR